jgi:outer membrane protein OmpA-like peptidoglycan-associated protein
MARLIVFLFCLIIQAIAFGQKVTGEEYSFDRAEGWFVGSDKDYSVKVENGYYNISHFNNEQEEFFYRDFYIDPTKDYSIEAKISQNSGEENLGYGITYGTDDPVNSYNFVITSNGQFKIFKYVKDQYAAIKDWTSVPNLINPFGSPNVLTVKKVGSNMHYLVNGTEVFTCPSQKFLGRNVGMFVYSKISISVDYFKIHQELLINVVPNNSGLKYHKESLGPNIDTKFEEVMPVISSDGKTIFFDRKDHPENTGGTINDEIWYSTFVNGSWTKAKNIGSPLNNISHNFVFSVSPDLNTVLVANTYKSDGSYKGDGVSISHRTSTGWEIPQALVIDHYYNDADNVGFMLSSNRQVLLMSVKRNDSEGMHDLYVSFAKPNDQWTEPKNLGKTINTLGDELTPFLAADNVSLYFSTNGRPGYGDNDIFLSKRLDETWTKWSEPKNLGPEINTKEWDAYYTVEASGNYAYFASTSNSIGEDDIFRIRLTPEEKPNPVVMIYGTVYDKETNKPISADIIYQDLNSHKDVGEARANPKDGSYKIILPYGTIYGFHADKVGYYSESDNINLTDVKEYKEIKRDLYLTPIKVGNKIKLNNVFFVQSKPELISTSYPELDRLVEIMKTNPTLKIDIAGHTDNIGDPAKNQKLSEERVKVIKDYLLKNGIDGSRVTGKGYGGTKPVASNENEETRKMNRRVEFTIVEK